MSYVIAGLAAEPFRPFFGLPDAELAKHNVMRVIASSSEGFPYRVKLEDARRGESLLLINHEYHPAPTPYQGRHPIFVNESAIAPARFVDEVPAASGCDVEQLVLKLFENQDATYIHAHNASRGCFAARIDRN